MEATVFSHVLSPLLRIVHYVHIARSMKLETYLKQHRMSASSFARSINVDPATVLRIKAGKVFPHRRTMQAIWDATAGQVGPNDFLHSPAARHAGTDGETNE